MTKKNYFLAIFLNKRIPNEFKIMSLNRELKIIYGYRFDGIPITTYIDKLYECDDIKTQCEMLDSISTPDENNFVVCTDGMLCKYEYAGLLCYSSNCEENFSISYDSEEIKKLINVTQMYNFISIYLFCKQIDLVI